MSTMVECPPKSKMSSLKTARRFVIRQAEAHIPYISGAQLRERREEWVHQVTAWEPVYLQGYGNSCRMLLSSQEWNGGVTSSSIYRSMASRFCTSIRDLRDWYFKCLGKSQSVPLPVAGRGLVFFAVKTRTPRSKNDGAIGYIANTAVKHVEPIGERRSRIYIEGNHTIDTEMSAKNVQAQRRHAEEFKLYLTLEGVLQHPYLQPGHI